MPSKKYSEIKKRLKSAQQKIRPAIGEGFVVPKGYKMFVADEPHKVAQGLYLIAEIFHNAADSWSLSAALTLNLTDINASVAAIQGSKNSPQDLPIPEIKDKITFKLGLVAYEIFSALDKTVPGAADYHSVLKLAAGWSEKVSKSPSVLKINLEEYLKQNQDEELKALFLAIVKDAKSENKQEENLRVLTEELKALRLAIVKDVKSENEQEGDRQVLTLDGNEDTPEHQAQIDIKPLVVNHIAPWITYAVVGYFLDLATTDLLVFCFVYCCHVYSSSNIIVRKPQYLLEDGELVLPQSPCNKQNFVISAEAGIHADSDEVPPSFMNPHLLGDDNHGSSERTEELVTKELIKPVENKPGSDANPQISFLTKEKILLISGICFTIGVVAFTLCLGILLKDPAFAVFSVELTKEAINSLCIIGAIIGGASVLLGMAGFTKACILDNFECSKTPNCC